MHVSTGLPHPRSRRLPRPSSPWSTFFVVGGSTGQVLICHRGHSSLAAFRFACSEATSAAAATAPTRHHVLLLDYLSSFPPLANPVIIATVSSKRTQRISRGAAGGSKTSTAGAWEEDGANTRAEASIPWSLSSRRLLLYFSQWRRWWPLGWRCRLTTGRWTTGTSALATPPQLGISSYLSICGLWCLHTIFVFHIHAQCIRIDI
nr:uncharacterized protein LOC127341950 [Lolium perenne]